MKTTIIEPHKSSLGMEANIAALVIYIAMAVVSWIPWLSYLAWAVPVVFFILEKQSKFVKFHAVQALIIGIIRVVIVILFAIIAWALTPRGLEAAVAYLQGGIRIWVVVGAISTIIGLAITALVVYLMIMAYSYKQVELPVMGDIAAKISAKLDTINVGSTPGSGVDDKKSDTDSQNNS